jgi:MFS family permease
LQTPEKKNFHVKTFAAEIILIYTNSKFILVNVAYFILSFVIVAPHNFLPSHIKLHNIDDPSSISISLIGISALFGQITIGYLADVYRAKNWLIFSVCIAAAGVLTCMLPLIKNLYYIYAFSVLFGFFTSVNYVLQSSLVIGSLGLANLTLAFGCLQLCQGIDLKVMELEKKKFNQFSILKDFLHCSERRF